MIVRCMKHPVSAPRGSAMIALHAVLSKCKQLEALRRPVMHAVACSSHRIGPQDSNMSDGRRPYTGHSYRAVVQVTRTGHSYRAIVQ